MTVSFDQDAGRDALRAALFARVHGKAKPAGSLGRLEALAIQIGMVTGTLTPDLGSAKVVVFAGDHGLTAEGVTAYPSVVTREIAKLILAGGAGINICAGTTATDVLLVDAGMLAPLDDHPNLLDRRIGNGTANARHGPAMDRRDFENAMAAGGDILPACWPGDLAGPQKPLIDCARSCASKAAHPDHSSARRRMRRPAGGGGLDHISGGCGPQHIADQRQARAA